MTKRRMPLLATLLLFAPISSGWAQCTSSQGVSAPYSTVRLVLNNSSGMPGAIQQGISAGASAWNQAGCNNGDDYPAFFTSGAADATVQIFYETSLSSFRDASGGSVCALIDFGGSTTGTNTTIILYRILQLADGSIHDCFPTSAIAADSMAHELGHYLGLGNSTCTNYIMSGRSSSFVNGQLVWSTSRQVQADECAFADAVNASSIENNNETNGDPFCNAYCWTECIGSYCPEGAPSCPILVDLENDGIHLSGIDDPVWFDIDADGDQDLITWTDRGEGLLVLDRNGNGTVDDGGELFGDATRLANGSLASNGYVALAELDSWAAGGNQDGFVAASDAVFASLRMWTDSNHDGISQPEELLTLDETGIQRIGVDYRESRRRDRHGNELRFLGTAWRSGHRGVLRPLLTWDVYFLLVP